MEDISGKILDELSPYISFLRRLSMEEINSENKIENHSEPNSVGSIDCSANQEPEPPTKKTERCKLPMRNFFFFLFPESGREEKLIKGETEGEGWEMVGTAREAMQSVKKKTHIMIGVKEWRGQWGCGVHN